jgi:MFS family permease
MVLVVRLADRLGKGVRAGPRDALLAAATPTTARGRAYGFNRAMDNVGAVIGPACATLLMSFGLGLRTVFLLAAVPALFTLFALVVGVKEPPSPSAPASPTPSPSSDVPIGAAFWRYLFVLALFGLGNSSDAFLLLRARSLGVAAALIPILWLVHNLVKALLSTAGGALSDRYGRKGPIAVGWAVYALSYLGFARARASWQMWPLFAVYGLYYAIVEGSEKALVVDLAPAERRGAAFGAYHAVVGLTALPASLVFGALADRYGAAVPLTASAGLAGLSALLLVTRVPAR